MYAAPILRRSSGHSSATKVPPIAHSPPIPTPASSRKGEQRVAKNRGRGGAHPAISVGYRPPNERQPPSHEKKGKQQPAVEANVGGSCRNTRLRQKLAHRRDQNERVDERIHAVERPSGPGGPKTAHLVFR